MEDNVHSRVTVLIAEDDRASRELLVMALEAHDYCVVAVETATQALAVLKCERVDLFLLDLRLGRESGIDVLRWIRQSHECKTLPVLLLTGTTDRDVVLEVSRLGVRDYMLKRELSHTDLLARIRRYTSSIDANPSSLASREATKVLMNATFDDATKVVGEHCASRGNRPGACSVPSLQRPTASAPINVDASAKVASGRQGLNDRLNSLKPISTRAHVMEQVDKCTSLKALSPTVTQLLEMTNSPDCSLEQISQVVKRDPVIALKVLKIANSVVYNRGTSIDTVQKALARIGVVQIRQVVLNISVIESFHGNALGEHFNSHLFWEHSIATGLIAAAITRSRNGNERAIDAAFTSGLLHDVARMVFAEKLGDLYKNVLATSSREQLPLDQVESRMLLCNHAELMEHVLLAWGFSKHLIEPIAMHHISAEEISVRSGEGASEIFTLALANRLAHAMLLGSSGDDFQCATEQLVRALDLESNAIKLIEDRIPGETADMKYAMLQSGESVAWTDYSETIRNKFQNPMRPLFVSTDPISDGYRILFERLKVSGEKNKPNIGVVYITSLSARSGLCEALIAAEQKAGVNQLPLIILSPTGAMTLESQIVDNRKHRLLSSPFTLARLADTVNYLLNPVDTMEPEHSV